MDTRCPTAVILPSSKRNDMFVQVVVWRGKRFEAYSTRSAERALENALHLVTEHERTRLAPLDE